MLGHSPSPLASPVSSWDSPFSHGGSHGVAGSSCYWSLSALKQPSCPQTACRSPCPRSPAPSPAQRSRTEPPQPLPATSRGHSGTPGGACTSPTFPGEPGQVVGSALRLSAPLDVPAARFTGTSEPAKIKLHPGQRVSKSERKANSGELFPRIAGEPEIRAAHS